MTKAKANEKVQLAQDVLDQIAAKRFIAEPGTYFESPGQGAIKREAKTSKELQALLQGLDDCHVCARGALFVTMIERYNEVEPCDFNFDAQPLHAETRFFNAWELSGIEEVFEVHQVIFDCITDTSLYCKAKSDTAWVPAYKKYLHSHGGWAVDEIEDGESGTESDLEEFVNLFTTGEERMVIIMETIVESNGVVSQKTMVEKVLESAAISYEAVQELSEKSRDH